MYCSDVPRAVKWHVMSLSSLRLSLFCYEIKRCGNDSSECSNDRYCGVIYVGKSAYEEFSALAVLQLREYENCIDDERCKKRDSCADLAPCRHRVELFSAYPVRSACRQVECRGEIDGGYDEYNGIGYHIGRVIA